MSGTWDILTGEPERDQRNVSVLLESVEALYGVGELDELMRKAVDHAIRVTGAERGLLLVEGKDGELETQAARDVEGNDLPLDTAYSRKQVGEVWENGTPSITMDTADQAHLTSLSDSILALRLISLMAVPMRVKGARVGVLYVDSTAKVREFTPADLSVFQALAGLVALAVENARLNARKTEQERLQRDLKIAQDIQQGFLPKDIPQPAGFELAGIGRACDETSGDYYDVIPIDDGRLALVIGDVTGHGLGPALLMASTRALIHAGLRLGPRPVAVVESVNSFLERDTPCEVFMSLFLAAFDPVSRTLTYVSGGHNPPLLLRADGTVEELDRTGPVLGVIPGAQFGLSEPCTLASGDVLMLYTDGIYEAHDKQKQMFGEQRLQESLTRNAQSGGSAQEILAGVLEDVDAFVAGQPLEDDVTCLVVRAL